MVVSSHRHPFSLLKRMGVGADNSSPTNHGLVCLITSIHPGAYPELPHWNKRHSYNPGDYKGFRSTVSGTRGRDQHKYFFIHHNISGAESVRIWTWGGSLLLLLKRHGTSEGDLRPQEGCVAYAAGSVGTAIHWLSVDLENDPDHSLLNSWKKTLRAWKMLHQSAWQAVFSHVADEILSRKMLYYKGLLSLRCQWHLS